MSFGVLYQPDGAQDFRCAVAVLGGSSQWQGLIQEAERTVELPDGEALIGRRSSSRNIHPAIDLSPGPEDVAVSRQHARLTRGADGAYTLEDLGSANGTYLNDGKTPITPHTVMVISNGDRIFVGAWTKLTLVSLEPAPVHTHDTNRTDTP